MKYFMKIFISIVYILLDIVSDSLEKVYVDHYPTCFRIDKISYF